MTDLLGEHRRQRTAAAGDVILREHDPGDIVIELVEGRVKVTVATDRGPTAVLGFRGPGDLLGEIGVLLGRRSATVTAIEPLAYASVTGSDFRRHVETHPGAALELARRLAVRLLAAERRAAAHLTSDATARVAARLVELAEQYDTGDGRLALPLSQDELAGLTGSSLESVARALRTLRSAGWLESGRREITIRDLAALRVRAGS